MTLDGTMFYFTSAADIRQLLNVLTNTENYGRNRRKE
jgi:hypothetical protein